jgi:hypothetical protein
MDLLLSLGQILRLATGERRHGERRKSARIGCAGRRRSDAMTPNEARSLFISQRKELAELALKYGTA